MKLPYLIDAIYSQPALITPQAHAAIRHLLEARLDDAIQFDPQAAQRQGEYCGKKVNLPSMEVIDGIAHIPVAGAIGSKLSGFAKYAGAVDTMDVAKDIEEAEGDKQVKAVLFDVDSPGGMVAGTPELADRIAGMKKPTAVFSDGMIASAAYWLSSSAQNIYTTRTTLTGSIGVYLPVFDYTKAFDMEGVRVELITAGKLKGVGYPGTQLSDEGREYLKARVNDIYTMFREQVTSRRRGKSIDNSTMQGQTFLGPEAYKRGLIDAIVRDKSEAVELLKASL